MTRELFELTRGATMLKLVGGFLLPPVAWLVALQVVYAVGTMDCRGSAMLVVAVACTTALVAALAPVFLLWRSRERFPEGDSDAPVAGRTRFLIVGTVANGIFFSLVIVATALAGYLLRDCP